MTDEQQKVRTVDFTEQFHQIAKEVFLPNAEAIWEIYQRDEIAIVIVEPDQDAQEFARKFGWDGTSPVFEMRRTDARKFARRLERQLNDLVAANWLTRYRGPGRIYLLIQAGHLLVNFKPERGFWIEPGSTDAEKRLASN